MTLIPRWIDHWTAAFERDIAEPPETPDQRAVRLLHEIMTPVQRASWARDGYCDETKPDGRVFRLYRLRRGVTEYSRSGDCRRSHCVGLDPRVGLPEDDHAIGLLLWLRADVFGLQAAAGQGYWIPL